MAASVLNTISAVRTLVGTFTHTEGDAAESFTVAGYVYDAKITMVDDAARDVTIGYTVSRDTTTGISTVTILCKAAVTDGRFIVWVSSM